MTDAGLYKAINNEKISSDYLEKIAKELETPVGVFFGEENKLAYSLNWRMGINRIEKSLIMIVDHYIKKTDNDRFKGVNELFEGGHILDETFGRDRSTDDILLFSWIKIFQKSGTGETEFEELKNNGVISEICCKILCMLADSRYNFEEMLRTYDIVSKYEKYNKKH